MHQDYAILKRQDNIDAYFKDIEKIYVSNGWGSSYPEGLLRQMFSASYYLLATTTSGAVGFLRGFTDGAMVTHLSEIVVDPGLQRREIPAGYRPHHHLCRGPQSPGCLAFAAAWVWRVPEPEGVFKKKRARLTGASLWFRPIASQAMEVAARGSSIAWRFLLAGNPCVLLEFAGQGGWLRAIHAKQCRLRIRQLAWGCVRLTRFMACDRSSCLRVSMASISQRDSCRHSVEICSPYGWRWQASVFTMCSAHRQDTYDTSSLTYS